MTNTYIIAAEKVSNLAEEYQDDYNLANLLRAGSSKIMKLAQKDNGTIIKSSSFQNEELKQAANK